MTTAMLEPKTIILRHLQKGEDNAIKKKDLALLCDMNERAMRQNIVELVTEGYPICGNPHPPYGYYLATTTDELNREMKTIKSYGRELFRRYSALRRCKRKMEIHLPITEKGQIRMI